MTLRERIENNPAIWLFGALGTGFLAGLGAYKSILEIAQLDVVPKARLEELEAGSRPEVEPEPIQQVSESSNGGPSPEKPTARMSSQPGRNVASRDSQEEFIQKPDRPEETEEAEPPEFRLSEALPPFPENFDLIRPGMKLSEARAAFPRGEVSSRWYSVGIESGLFTHVVFYIHILSRGEDPPIDSIHFFYRDAEARQVVISETLRNFGGIKHSSESLGVVLSWPDVNGFALILDDNSYEVSLRNEE